MNLRISALMMVYFSILAIVAIVAFTAGFAKQSTIADKLAVVNQDLRDQLLTDVTERVSTLCQPTTLSDGTPLEGEEINPKAWQTITDINSRLAVVQHSQVRVEQACRAIAQDQIIKLSGRLGDVQTAVGRVETNLKDTIDLVTVPCEPEGNCTPVGVGKHLKDVPAELQNTTDELSGKGEGPLSQLQRQVDQLDQVMDRGNDLIDKGDQVIQASWSQLSLIQTRLLEILPEQMSLSFDAEENTPAIVIEFDRPFATECSTISVVILPERTNYNASGEYQSAIFADNVRKVGEKTCQLTLQKLLSDEELMTLFKLEKGATLKILAFVKTDDTKEGTVIE